MCQYFPIVALSKYSVFTDRVDLLVAIPHHLNALHAALWPRLIKHLLANRIVLHWTINVTLNFTNILERMRLMVLRHTVCVCMCTHEPKKFFFLSFNVHLIRFYFFRNRKWFLFIPWLVSARANFPSIYSLNISFMSACETHLNWERKKNEGKKKRNFRKIQKRLQALHNIKIV